MTASDPEDSQPFTERDRYRDLLKTVLQSADDESFVQLLWAANVVQSDYSTSAAAYLRGVAAEAMTSDMTSQWAIHKWEIEDLANELFSTPKRPLKKRQRKMDYTDFQYLLRLAGTLRALHNAEDGIDLIVMSALAEMKRIAARQFDWQRGFLNKAQFYRSSYIYGQGPCAEYFKSRHGIGINELSMVGFGIHGHLMGNPFMPIGMNWIDLGITAEQVLAALNILAASAEETRKLATELRSYSGHSAYKPSFLRRIPCIIFEGIRVRSPLPQLIIERITSGLFFDVVDGGGDIRADYGRRFEKYCLMYLRAMLPTLEFLGEWRYGPRKAAFDSPDIICKLGGKVRLAIECKATRMSFAAKFSQDPLAERGYGDVVKAVFQLWRFFSHCRRGIVQEELSPDAIGVVLTLEAWLTMAAPLYRGVLERACTLAEGDPEITEGDRRPIEFCAVTDLEPSLARATASSFLSAMAEAAKPEKHGWMFSSIHEDFIEEGVEERLYPFSENLGEVLPWWEMVQQHIRARKEQMGSPSTDAPGAAQ